MDNYDIVSSSRVYFSAEGLVSRGAALYLDSGSPKEARPKPFVEPRSSLRSSRLHGFGQLI